ncbi:endo alpha-1,4 polygalactosaminidase [Cellulomonas marina]|uniref:Glycoside-hydrolase family GH114 n=1 Tax=Cellulomonas marina TaxID=988821 RepID=A0A1I0YC84_9CELL|nr:endo alpha-1,4 polygalactosaminidase [Cellulomonas marina]GIG29665.1 hypothetical protein Cma02nite_22650 [Cellulomonas marina]SFB11005.1 Glycoside-hydrolase family GH114 [Cellulomonas marina]
MGDRARARARGGARRLVGVLLGLVALVPLVGCTPAGDEAASARRLPPVDAVVDYQLGGAYPPAPGIDGVVRDATDVPAPGLWSACYVNAFQTQPQERDTWLADHPDLVLHGDRGTPVVDPGWPDELLLDTSTAARRAAVAERLDSVLQRCADAGFDAVELDNLDSWTRSGGRLTADDALALARLVVARAHGLGLAVAQKNAADLGARGRDEAGFDLVVAEECVAYDECAAYAAVYGPHVLDVEYVPDDARAGADPVAGWADACADPTGRRPPCCATAR